MNGHRPNCRCGDCTAYLPPSDEIALECQRIRESWSAAERLRRMADDRARATPWSVPTFSDTPLPASVPSPPRMAYRPPA